jgi:hypothetical protein
MRYTAIIPFAALAPAVLLAACGGNDVALKNASVEEVAKQVDAAGGTGFRAGKWETTVQTVSVDIPGIEGEMKKQMTDAMLSKKETSTSCITEEQAKNPPAQVLAASNGKCKYDNFVMAGGKIDGTLVCPIEGTGGEMKMRMAGTFDGETFAIDNEMNATTPAGPGMHIKAKTTGKRIGECSDAEKKAANAAMKAG